MGVNKSSTYFKNNHLKHTCKNCGRKISLAHWSITYLCNSALLKSKPKYCNLSCSAKSHFPKGKNHPAYKNGSGRGYSARQSKQNIIILGRNCEKCGRKSNLNAHHKDENPRNNILSNIQVLCGSCHMKHHWKPYKKYKNRRQKNKALREKSHQLKDKKIKLAMYKKFRTYIYYTAKDICKKHKFVRERVRQLRESGDLKSMKIGGLYYYVNYAYSKKKCGRPKIHKVRG